MAIKLAETFTTTGTWLRAILDMELIMSYSVVDVTRMLSSIVRSSDFDQSNGDFGTIKNVIVENPRSISITIAESNRFLSTQTASHLYVSVLQRWIRYHIKYISDQDYELLEQARPLYPLHIA